MIYRIDIRDEYGSSEGYEYCGSLREMRRRMAELKRDGHRPQHSEEYGAKPTPKNKREVIALLNFWADHPDTG